MKKKKPHTTNRGAPLVRVHPLEGLSRLVERDPYAFLTPELREAKMLEETDPEKALEIRTAFFARIREEKKAKEADEKAKRNRTGKYDPTNFPLGKCRICEGDVVAKYRWVTVGEVKFGGPSNSHLVHSCFYCKGCGVQYQFVPKPKEDQ